MIAYASSHEYLKEYPDRSTVIAEGSKGDTLHVIVKGEAYVFSRGINVASRRGAARQKSEHPITKW